LLTRTGLDWTHRYRATIQALSALPVTTAYLDGELCAVGPDGVPAFSRLMRLSTMSVLSSEADIPPKRGDVC
jgi:ATP-dependent DNA ligase